MKPKRLAESAERAPHTHPDPVPPFRRNSRQPLAHSLPGPLPLPGCGVDKNHVNTVNTGVTRGRVQPGAGFDPLRGVTRLQPYLRAGPRQLKPALGGK